MLTEYLVCASQVLDSSLYVLTKLSLAGRFSLSDLVKFTQLQSHRPNLASWPYDLAPAGIDPFHLHTADPTHRTSTFFSSLCQYFYFIAKAESSHMPGDSWWLVRLCFQVSAVLKDEILRQNFRKDSFKGFIYIVFKVEISSRKGPYRTAWEGGPSSTSYLPVEPDTLCNCLCAPLCVCVCVRAHASAFHVLTSLIYILMNCAHLRLLINRKINIYSIVRFMEMLIFVLCS